MINKFPKFSEQDQKSLKTWLNKEKHQNLSKYHTYVACGNESEALRSNHYANTFEYILMMMEYHTEPDLPVV